MNLKKAIRRCLAILLTLILILPFGEAVAGEEKELLRLHQVNIGGGDAYILTVGDLVILVDSAYGINEDDAPAASQKKNSASKKE